MRVITLVLIIVAVFFFAKNAHGRTIMLDEEQVETSMSEEQFYYIYIYNKREITQNNINCIENLRKGK